MRGAEGEGTFEVETDALSVDPTLSGGSQFSGKFH